jgi:chitinase
MASNPFIYCLFWVIAFIGLAAPLVLSVSNGNGTGCRTQSNIVADTENSSGVSMEGGYKSIAYFVDWVSISLVFFQTNPRRPS